MGASCLQSWHRSLAEGRHTEEPLSGHRARASAEITGRRPERPCAGLQLGLEEYPQRSHVPLWKALGCSGRGMGRATPWLSQAQGLGTQVRVGRESPHLGLSAKSLSSTALLCVPWVTKTPKSLSLASEEVCTDCSTAEERTGTQGWQ